MKKFFISVFVICLLFASPVFASTSSNSSLLDSLYAQLISLSSYIQNLKPTTQTAALSGAGSGLVAYYTFDEGSGTTAGDSAGTNTGTLTNGPTWTTGRAGGALSFDGVDDSVRASMTVPTGDVTVSAWIYNKGLSPYSLGVVVSDGKFMCGVADYQKTFSCSNDNGATNASANVNSSLLNQWQYFTIIRKADGTLTLYVDGVQSGIVNQSGGAVVGGNALAIGERWDPAYQFNGFIDDVRIYNRALSTSEITQLYSGTITPPTPDTQAPTTPTSLTATAVSSTAVNLTWTASTDNTAVTGYKIYRAGVQVGTSATTLYSDTGLTQNTTYSYTVSAYDAVPNTSTQSSPASVTTPITVVDNTAPTTPTNLSATAISSSQINLGWTASTDTSGISGYKIYRNGTLITTTSGAGTTYSSTGLTANTTYSFTVSAVDASTNLNTSPQTSSVSGTTQVATPAVTSILTQDRVVAWGGGNVGVKENGVSGIPSRTTICATLSPSGGDDTFLIQSALESCPTNQVVMLSSGTFHTGQVDWQGVNNGVVLRGSGRANTSIQTDGAMLMRGMWYDPSLPGDIKTNLTVSAVKGGTTITVDDASWICPSGTCTENDYYVVDQTNDPSFVSNVGETYPNDPALSYRYAGDRGLGQIVKVVSKNGNTLTIEIPLYYGFSTTYTAQIAKIATLWKSGRGIEDLKIINTNTSGDANTIKFENAVNSWVKNVEIANTGRVAVISYFSYRLEIRDSYIHHATNYDSGQGYGVALYYTTSASLVENNTLQHLHLFLSTDYGDSGNVFSYNYAFDPFSRSGQEPGYGTHGMHVYMNLLEGNYFTTKFGADQTHGSGSHQVLLRNRIQGHDTIQSPPNNYDQVAIHLMRYNRHSSALGNVLGLAGYSTNYKGVAPTFNCPSGTIICLGDGYDGYDDEATVDFLRIANYDYSPTHNCTWSDLNNRCMTATEVSNAGIPPSLYLPSKPTWFGNLVWPPIGPDVAGLTNDIPAKYCYEHGGQMPDCLVGTVISLLPDLSLPQVSITSPLQNSTLLGSSVPLSVSASDPTPQGQTQGGIATVEFLLDGSLITPLLTTPTTGTTYSGTWDTSGVSNGAHTLTARATDINGNISLSSPVSLTIANIDQTAGGTTVTPPPTGGTTSSNTGSGGTSSNNTGGGGGTSNTSGGTTSSGGTTPPTGTITPAVPQLPPKSSSSSISSPFTHTLSLGSTGDDVKALQVYLNQQGYLIASTGLGSKGQESTYFGDKTRLALIRYQVANSLPPTGQVDATTLAHLKTKVTSSSLTKAQLIAQLIAQIAYLQSEIQKILAQRAQTSVVPPPCCKTVSLPSSYTTQIADLETKLNTLRSSVSIPLFTRSLSVGMTGDDVTRLRTLLSSEGFTTTDSTLDSSTFTTNLKTALAKFQEYHRDTILAPNNFLRGEGGFGPSTRQAINDMLTIQALPQDKATLMKSYVGEQNALKLKALGK